MGYGDAKVPGGCLCETQPQDGFQVSNPVMQVTTGVDVAVDKSHEIELGRFKELNKFTK